MKTLPLQLNISAMQSKLLQQSEEIRFDTLKHLLILRIQGCLAISSIIEISRSLPTFNKDYISRKIECCVTDGQLFLLCKIIREMRTLNLITQSLVELQKLSNQQIEKIYHKQFK